MTIVIILLTLAFIIFLSPYLASLFKLSTSSTEIILGIIAGGLGLLEDNQYFKISANIGFYFLMFLAGTEVDIKIFTKISKQILQKTVLFLSLLYIISIAIVFCFELNKILIIAIPLMSVGLLSTLYKDYGKDEKWLNLAMLVGVIGEIVSIAVLTIAGAYLKTKGFGLDLIIHVLALVGFLLISIVVINGLSILFWWYPNLKTILMPRYDRQEKDIRLAMALFCSIIAITVLIDLEYIIGAFIAGTFIPTFFNHHKELPAKLSSFGFGFIIPIFFIYIGSTVNINAIFINGTITTMLELTICMILFRIILSFFFLKELGKKDCLLFALSLSMPFTLLVAVATIAYNTNYITKNFYFSLIIASLFEAILSTTLIRVIRNYNSLKS